mgnify:CR=1 FL=1
MIINNQINFLIISSISLLILYYGKFLIVPLLFSLFFFIILKSLSIRLSSFKFIKIKYKVSFTLISLFFAFLIYFIGILLESNLSKVIQNAQLYQKNLSFIFDYIKDSSLGSLPVSFNQFILNINFANIFSKILNSLTGIASNFSLVIIYLIFIVLEENLFKTKILKLFS